MIASYLKSSVSSFSVDSDNKLNNHRTVSLQKKNHKLIKPLFASIFLLLCIILVPQKPPEVASICEKYNSSAACQVW